MSVIRHLSDRELVLRLYDATGCDDHHLASCSECRQRWSALLQRRAALSLEPALPSHEFLRRQRRDILAKIERDAAPSPFHGLRSAWVPTLVAAILMVGLIATRPGLRPSSVKSQAVSAEPAPELIGAAWYEDAYSVSQPLEPRAASAIRGLFAEGQSTQ
ncbi:MAG: hypothetical protein ABI995_10245 [Acidobacteriota bacterium]